MDILHSIKIRHSEMKTFVADYENLTTLTDYEYITLTTRGIGMYHDAIDCIKKASKLHLYRYKDFNDDTNIGINKSRHQYAITKIVNKLTIMSFRLYKIITVYNKPRSLYALSMKTAIDYRHANSPHDLFVSQASNCVKREYKRQLRYNNKFIKESCTHRYNDYHYRLVKHSKILISSKLLNYDQCAHEDYISEMLD